MIPFPFNRNRFSFFVADHLLVGQLCTNPKSDRSLLPCLRVTHCWTSKIEDVPLYNSCSLPIQVMTTGQLPSPSKCKSERFNAWWYSSMHRTTLWMWWSRNPKLRTPDQGVHRKGPGNNSWNSPAVWWSSGAIRWLVADPGCGSAGPQVQRDPDFASEGVLRLCTLLLLAHLLPWPEPAGRLRSVIRREHHQHDLPQHQSQPDRHHPPSIRRAFLWKRHASSSRSVSRRWLRLRAVTLNWCQIFVAASHQTRLDTRSKARRPIKVGIKGEAGSGTSQVSNPAGQCCSSAHLVQCEPDEASSFTNPNVGPGTYASLRLKLDAWSSAV